jgi:hypothetical protein
MTESNVATFDFRYQGRRKSGDFRYTKGGEVLLPRRVAAPRENDHERGYCPSA